MIKKLTKKLIFQILITFYYTYRPKLKQKLFIYILNIPNTFTDHNHIAIQFYFHILQSQTQQFALTIVPMAVVSNHDPSQLIFSECQTQPHIILYDGTYTVHSYSLSLLDMAVAKNVKATLIPNTHKRKKKTPPNVRSAIPVAESVFNAQEDIVDSDNESAALI